MAQAEGHPCQLWPSLCHYPVADGCPVLCFPAGMSPWSVPEPPPPPRPPPLPPPHPPHPPPPHQQPPHLGIRAHVAVDGGDGVAGSVAAQWPQQQQQRPAPPAGPAPWQQQQQQPHFSQHFQPYPSAPPPWAAPPPPYPPHGLPPPQHLHQQQHGYPPQPLQQHLHFPTPSQQHRALPGPSFTPTDPLATDAASSAVISEAVHVDSTMLPPSIAMKVGLDCFLGVSTLGASPRYLLAVDVDYRQCLELVWNWMAYCLTL